MSIDNHSLLHNPVDNKVQEINRHINSIINFFEKNSDSSNAKPHGKIHEMSPSCRYFRLLRANLCYFKYIKYSANKELNIQLLNRLTKIADDLSNIYQMTNDLSMFITANYHSYFEDIVKNAESSLDLVYEFIFNKIDADIKNIENKSNTANGFSDMLNRLDVTATQQLDDLHKEIAIARLKNEKDVKEMQAKLAALDDQIVQVALAHSFNSRVEKLEKPREHWLYGVVCSLILIPIAFFAFNCFTPFIPTDLWTSLSIRTPLAVALFWLVWFCSKKYSYVCHVQDDYRYKYDLAMAYKGYSGEVMKLKEHEQLLTLLLGSLIENISRSPIDNIRPETHSPWAETISPIVEKMNK